MVNKTTNYGLTKPLPEDFYDVNIQNENMDIIDGELKKLHENTPDVSGQIAKSTLKIHRMNKYCSGAGWYRIGRFTMGQKNDMFTTGGSPYSDIVRIYIHGNVNNGAPYPFVVDAYLMWSSGGILRQQPAQHEPQAVTQIRICNVTGDSLSYDIDIYYPHSVGNDVHIAVEPLSSTFVSSGLSLVTETTGTVTNTLTLTKNGFLDDLTAEDVDALPNTKPVPIEKGGTGATSAVDARTNLDTPSNADLTDVYDEILSRGEQLVVNGSGMLGDNTGFSRFTFDGNVTNKSQGSFKYNRPAYEIYTGDQFIPINIGKNILCELDIKSQNGLTTWASFLDFYDVDKKKITATNYNHVYASLTTLTQDLKNGDTVVHFADLSGWNANAPDAIDGFIFWGYTNSFGKVYPARTYSQNVWSSLFNAAGVDVANNTITLKAPWNYGTFKAGTEVSQCIRNGGYNYFMPTQTIPTDWLHAKGIYGSGNISVFADAAYAKIGFLCNSNRASDTTWFTNVSVKEYVPATEPKTSVVTLTTSGWKLGSDERYYQTVSVNGVTADTKMVMVDVDLSTTDADAKIAYLEAWAIPSANEVIQGAGTLTFYAWEIPTVNIPVNVGVM